MSICRNCESTDLRDLGFTGVMAPFFLRRVYNAELISRVSTHAIKRRIQQTTRSLFRALSRIHHTAAAVELQICLRCSFLQTTFPFPDDGIARLYADYRSDSYNRQRSSYEPEYAAVADRIGNHTEDGLGRVEALTAWLESRINIGRGAMLDFGGADGRYLPSLSGPRFVYEISDFPPAPGVTRIASQGELARYPYVQLSHVLEHVTHPLNMVREVAALVEDGGYLFVEVPQDLETSVLERIRTGRDPLTVTVHEHINQYSLLAVEKLLGASGLEVVEVSSIQVESPVRRQAFIRGLARRRAMPA